MDIKYEYLEMLPEIKKLLIKSTSPYLSKKELADYLKVSESFIKQKMLNGSFVEDKHYFKIGEAKIVFCKLEVDNWVRAVKEGNNGKSIHKKRKDISEYISQWSKDH
jgi:predicted DNA-binding transcriptional regulator AlpA